jgi:hypothetical protein
MGVSIEIMQSTILIEFERCGAGKSNAQASLIIISTITVLLIGERTETWF